MKSNMTYEVDTNKDWAKVPGLKRLRKCGQSKRVGVCPNCKCERYAPCTCTKKAGKS